MLNFKVDDTSYCTWWHRRLRRNHFIVPFFIAALTHQVISLTEKFELPGEVVREWRFREEDRWKDLIFQLKIIVDYIAGRN